ncbi:hypothetical protein FKM82_000968 [Ascaphus truei]
MLITLQETSGMPWWANIVCATITLRTAVTLPLSVYQLYILARVENLQPEIENLAKRLRYEVSVYGKQKGWSDKVAKFNFRKNLRRIISGLYVRDNCHPFKASLLIWIQIPMWIFVSISLRNFSLPATGPYAGEAVSEATGRRGALVFLTSIMPILLVLPISLGGSSLADSELFALRKIELSRFQKIVTNFIRAISVLMTLLLPVFLHPWLCIGFLPAVWAWCTICYSDLQHYAVCAEFQGPSLTRTLPTETYCLHL